MSWQDFVNGTFELLGAPFVLLSVIKLLKDKQVRGISWPMVGFFSSWGIWNLYYYPHLEQWASFIGGVAVVAVNLLYLGLLLYYLRK